jgi:hypothetical protein
MLRVCVRPGRELATDGAHALGLPAYVQVSRIANSPHLPRRVVA